MSSYLMTKQGNLNRSQVLPWCQFLVHITGNFAQDGLLPAALVPSSRTFRWIRDPRQLGSPAMLHEMCRGSSFVDLASLASSKLLRSSSLPRLEQYKVKATWQKQLCKLRRCCHGAPGTGHLCSPTPQRSLVEMGDSHLQPLEPCRQRRFIKIASTSRQSALAHEDAAVRCRALASCP